MPNSAVMRVAFSTLSALFGGLGMYFLYSSIEDPGQIPRALIFLGSAISIVLSSQYYNQGPTNRR
jgi:hypothetical protein